MRQPYYILHVPSGWEHPINDEGNFEPYMGLDDCTNAQVNWTEKYMEWTLLHKTENAQQEATDFWKEIGLPPRQIDFLFEEKSKWVRNCFQIYYINPTKRYQYIPVSPVFSNLGKLAAWLIENGFPECPGANKVNNDIDDDSDDCDAAVFNPFG